MTTTTPETVIFTARPVPASLAVGERSGFNALCSSEVWRVTADIDDGNGMISRYTVAEFYTSRIVDVFATEGESAATEYADSMNDRARRCAERVGA